MDNLLREKFSIPHDWTIKSEPTVEKERINQTTETKAFTATSSDKQNVRTFTFTRFTDHTGTKTSWCENT